MHQGLVLISSFNRTPCANQVKTSDNIFQSLSEIESKSSNSMVMFVVIFTLVNCSIYALLQHIHFRLFVIRFSGDVENRVLKFSDREVISTCRSNNDFESS